MPLTFNLLLTDEEIDPAEVRLLRHETRRYRGRTPYSLWRNDRPAFERYQSTQRRSRRSYFRGRYWASFVGTPDGRTVFVGLYEVLGIDAVPAGWRHDLDDRPLDPDVSDRYALRRADALAAYVGRMAIDWGAGARQWVQRADRQDKPIVELRERDIDPPFPGYASFLIQLSELEGLPTTWLAALGAAGGVYLLACPRSREQYVGSATGSGGFLARWRTYLDGGNGGNVALRAREPSDYRLSILQVAGSGDDLDAVLAMELLWKAKLQSREMGLNRN